MTDLTRYRSRTRDIQDQVERGTYGTWQAVPGAGSMLSVRGTGTVDDEVPILNFGYSFRLPTDSNAEVIMLSLGSDNNDKVALPTLPRDLQYQWGEGQGGVQHPTDPARRLEFNADETWLKDGNYKLGNNREVEVSVAGGNITINVQGNTALNITGTANLTATGDLTLAAPKTTINSDVTLNGKLAVVGATLTHNAKNVGDDHTHGGVDTGGGSTQGPN